MKKILISLFFIILLIGISSCRQYEEIVPHADDFAAWDGNYIYRGLYRSRTTGEDETLLIENIKYNDVTYYFDNYDYFFAESGKYTYYKNDIYYVFNTKTEKNLYEYDSCFIVKYSTKEKTTSILYANVEESIPFIIKKVTDTKIYLTGGYSNTLKDLYVIDIESKELSLFEDFNKISFIEEDVFVEKENIIYHMDIRTLNMKPLFNSRNCSVSIINNSKYVRFDINTSSNNESRYSVGYFNKETNEFKILINNDNTREINFINEEYFIFYENKPFNYKVNLKKEKTEYLEVNNVLCKINFENFTYEEIYEFENQNASYLNGKIIDGYYYMTMQYIKKGWFIFEGGRKFKTCKLNLTTFKLTKDKKSTVNNVERKTESITYGDFIYYFESQKFGPILGKQRAMYFYRKHINKDQPQLMQFFVYDDDMVIDRYEGTRSATLIWGHLISLTDDDFMILNY